MKANLHAYVQYTSRPKLTEDIFQCFQERKEEEKKEVVTKTKMSNGQVKNRDGLVKMTVSNGLMKNNFSYATVMTMSSEDKKTSNPPRPPPTGEMFGMKFRDRELPAPPLENNSSVESESTKKTSVETTRRSLLETTTSKTSMETVKKME